MKFARRRKAYLSYHETNGVELKFYSSDDIRRLSAVQIRDGTSFDNLSRPVPYGLYDPRMGPIDRVTRCSTCGMTMTDCPGHFGHIELGVPVYHPLLLVEIKRLLQSACFFCGRLRMDKELAFKHMKRIELIDAGLLVEAEELWGLPDTHSIDEHSKELPLGRDVHYLETFAQEKIQAAADEAGLCVAEFLQDLRRKRSSQIVKHRKSAVQQFFEDAKRSRCIQCHGSNPAVTLQKSTSIFYKFSPNQQRLNMGLGISYRASADPNATLDMDVEDKLSSLGAEKVADKINETRQMFMNTFEVREIIRKLFEKEALVMETIFAVDNVKRKITADTFFLDCLLVPSNIFRMPALMNGEYFESTMNSQFAKVIQEKEALLNSKRISKNEQWVALQDSVNMIMDGELGKNGQSSRPGVRQVIDRKQGLFRQHMMGKRVNFAARSVISPDPNIETNEIAIPDVFAKSLSYPQPVTPHNVKLMRQLVLNGPEKYPGANYILDENGAVKDLKALDYNSRVAIAKTLLTDSQNGASTKIVGRHVLRGDIMLVNRQPTLHKPSIMAHKARVLHGVRTIRLHYANCNTYNADFDGDEMNLHLPQNELARAEGYNLAITDNQYIIPTSGKPIRGLIQDHVVSGVLLTKKNAFFEREEYQHLIYSCLHHLLGTHKQIEMVEPCILKPKPMWTGKQIITTLLKNLTGDLPPMNLESKTKVPASQWGVGNEDEGLVIVKDSELLTGVLDKSQFGASANGLVHCAYECYGGEVAGQLLTCLGRLFTIYLHYHGFTCGMDDLVLTANGDNIRRTNLDEANVQCKEVTLKFLEVPNDSKTGKYSKAVLGKKMWSSVLADEGISRKLDAHVKSSLNQYRTEILKQCLPGGQMKPFPENCMSLMTVAGAKGSIVNFSQIACLLGQQEFEGRRVKPMISGKTLPSYVMHDPSARAGGFVMGRFLSGILPQDYFFHCMAGRDGLVDTAVKTARSGYLQRCLIKHLETLKVAYDRTVRDAENSIIQFRYGEDGVDSMHGAQINNFRFITMNKEALSHRFRAAEVASNFDIEDHSSPVVNEYNKKLKATNYTIDPVFAAVDPARHLGSISERVQQQLDKWSTDNPEKMVIGDNEELTNEHSDFALPESNLRALVNLKYLRSLAEPGENVGLLAAQSIGEPSTQMTLNTFHFAGVDMAHVTVGIPRLKELLMHGNTKTQIMKLPLNPSVTRRQAEKLASKLSRVSALDLYSDMTVTERFTRIKNYKTDNRYRIVKAQFSFPLDSIFRHYEISPLKLRSLCLVYFVSKIAKMSKRAQQEWSASAKKMFEVQGKPVDHLLQPTNNAEDRDEDEDDDDENRRDSDKEDEETTQPMEQEKEDMEEEKEEKEEKNDSDDEESETENAQESPANSKSTSAVESEEDESDSDENDSDGHSSSSSDDEIDNDKTGSTKKSKKKTVPGSKLSEAQEIFAEDDDEDEEEKDYLVARYARNYEIYPFLQSTSFDVSTGVFTIEMRFPPTMKILWENVLERAAESTYFVNPPNILNTVVDDTDPSKLVLAMEGANFQEVWRYPKLIDLHSVNTNDVQLVIDTFGIEAGRKMIQQELKMVFELYSITVDVRHLSLISDYMTFEGDQRPFNRRAMSTNPSPFLQMSYEQALTCGVNASLYGQYEALNSPSSRLVMGRTTCGGTGSFQILQRLKSNTGRKSALASTE